MPTWEEVLASFEATADEAEALLAGQPGTTAEAGAAPVAVDPWQYAMPPVPEHLRDRAAAVSRRQLALAQQLTDAVHTLRRHEQLVREQAARPTRPVYLDRTA